MDKIKMLQIKKHIRKCKRENCPMSFLGLVENKDLTPNVEALFTFVTPSGYTGYDWINGNEKMKQLIEEV